MPIAVDPDATWDYVLHDDRTIQGPDGESIPNPKPTVFQLRSLRVSDAARLEDEGSVIDGKAGVIRNLSGSTELKILRLCLAGVRDFFDAEGNEIEFDAEPDNKRNPTRFTATDKFLDRLSIKHRAELAREAQLRNMITADEKKA